MKQRITIAEVAALTSSQQDNLRRMWIPDRYDIAVSEVCVNAQTDEFKWVEFAVGDILVRRDGAVILKDLRLTDGYVKIMGGESPDDERQELHEPTSFHKSESLPLLTIGQMVSMLHLMDKSRFHFYLLSGNNRYACEIGDFNSTLKPELLKKHEKVDEIADVLWTTLRTAL